jgi:hypothetical protein
MYLRGGVSSPVFAGVVVALFVVASVGFTLYLTKPGAESMTQTTTDNMTVTTTEMVTQSAATQMTESNTTNTVSGSAVSSKALAFNASAGQMFHDGWLLIAPVGMNQYAFSVHAEGLESTQGMGDAYIVEGAQSSGSMASVPIGGQNATLSEFEVGPNGVGNFFIILDQNPFSSYESVSIVFLPGMQMTNATVVATASFTMGMR